MFLLANHSAENDSDGMEFSSVTVTAKANVYFEGKVVSHSIRFHDGSRKTLGIIQPGSYHFSTAAAEQMTITEGACDVTLDGETEAAHYAVDAEFIVPGSSGFTITVEDSVCQYICTFLG